MSPLSLLTSRPNGVSWSPASAASPASSRSASYRRSTRATASNSAHASERFAPPVGVPHLSLLYGAHDAAARDAAAAAAREQLAGGVRSSVGALQLWATGGGLSGVRGWHRVATFPLEGGSR